MSELQADPYSLLQKIFISKENDWQIGLAASMCLFISKQLSAEAQEQSILGEISFIGSPQEQRASKHWGQNWTYMDDLSVQPLSKFFSCRGKQSPFLTQKVKQSHNIKLRQN